MLGAIIGDIIGSPYEWHNIKTESEGEAANRHICIRYVSDTPEEVA